MVSVAQKTAKPEVPPEGHSVVLSDIDWETYERILEAFGDRRFRHTYVDGQLEIMSPLRIHELRKKLLARIIEMLSWRARIEIQCAGSTTLKRKLQKRGLEPDECYYVASLPLVFGKEQLDLRKDPPPDLAIEVDVTSKSLSRFEVYAKLGVPELWRQDGNTLEFLKLDAKKRVYTPIRRSLAFPLVTPADIQQFVGMLSTHHANDIMDAVVAWVDKKLHGKK